MRPRSRTEVAKGVLAEWIGMQAEVKLAHLALDSRHPQLVEDVRKTDKSEDQVENSEPT